MSAHRHHHRHDTGGRPEDTRGGEAGHAGHAAGDPDWEAMAQTLEREAELQADFTQRAAEWLRGLPAAGGSAAGTGEPDGAPPRVSRVLDVGSGPGVISCLLARAFPQAEVVAVDGSAELLDRARARAAREDLAGRVLTRTARLPEELAGLGTAELIWTSNAVHHLADQQGALDGLAGALRPGGLLAVAEGGLPPRFLPRDFGLGRPGFQSRLDVVAEDWFTDHRAGLPDAVATVESWPAMLERAGLVPVGSRTFLIDLPAPLPMPVREFLHGRLLSLRERLGERLDPGDRRTLDLLLDGDACTGILWRPDTFWLTARTVHAARSAAAR